MPSDKHYEDRVVRLSELIEPNQPPIIEGFSFERCNIYGPVVAFFQGCEVSFCNFRVDDLEEALWEVTKPRVAGAIQLKDCNFNGCQFEGVGIAGPPDVIEKIREVLAA